MVEMNTTSITSRTPLGRSEGCADPYTQAPEVVLVQARLKVKATVTAQAEATAVSEPVLMADSAFRLLLKEAPPLFAPFLF